MRANFERHELLAPVGDMEMCRAAVHNGADAIYVGFPGFNARGRTVDHSWEALEEMIRFCRMHEVKVFLALNVLVFEKELRDLLEALPKALALRPDAFIVQDLGLARLLRFLAPDQVLHASTQMTVTNHEAIRLTADLDLARYVLGREVSLKEMELIRAGTEKELEVFVHGALCVAYSGQCLTSEGFGGRSANRGQCAQSCRMEYDLIVDGARMDLGARRHLVSPKDLCGLDDIPRLMEIGIDSFKIEGRLKTPQYVASASAAYKGAMRAFASGTGGTAEGGAAPSRQDLQISYSRGFWSGWLGGVDHQRLVDGRFGSHRGLEAGRVIGRRGGILRVTSSRPLAAGDGVLFASYGGDGAERGTWGGRIFSAHPAVAPGTKVSGAHAAGSGSGGMGSRPADPAWELTFGNDFPAQEIPVGATIYLNDSPALEREIRRSYADKGRWKTLPLSARLEGVEGGPLRIAYTDARGFSARAETDQPLQAARNPDAALSADQAREEAASLAGTPFRLQGFDFAVAPGLFVPGKALRKARQAAIAKLLALREARPEPVIRSREEALAWMEGEALEGLPGNPAGDPADGRHRGRSSGAPEPARLNLLLRERTALEALDGLPLHTVYLDFEHGKDYKPAVEALRAMGFRAGIATTRILKPAEHHNLKVIRALEPDAVLVRNLGALEWFAGSGLHLEGDFSLNVSNSLAAAYLAGKGLSSLCPSYDLNQWQLFDLLDACGGSLFEVTVHQYLPSFHMEHCVFAAFLSEGSSFRDCGKPCEKHRVELRDHTGAVHPLKADQECRNTMFNGKPQSAARLVPALLARGVRRFRVETLYEDAAALREKVLAYARLVAGETAPEEVFARMGVVEKYGVMEGQLRSPAVHRDRKKG